ncbi:MAG: hypothetical protein KZQ92_21075 [Candidatus Thiodiazotropha sp. (ex Lucinoma borealis)]|nr:hypothetical protein [Candidatus Thiodiazotropha sp. (ex Lucinoma borealis)]
MNYYQQNTTSDDQEDKQNHSEEIQVNSEEVRNLSEQNAETFRTVLKGTQNGSERNDTHSETFRTNTPEVPKKTFEQVRTSPTCSENDAEHTITVREAARIFEEAGVSRTERALTNWCKVNNRGVVRLDCCYSEAEHRYYITPQSIDQIVTEERSKLLHRGQQNQSLFASEAEALTERVRNEAQNSSGVNDNHSEQNAEAFRTVPNGSENVRNGTSANTERDGRDDREEQTQNDTENRQGEPLDKNEKYALKELRMENYNLKVQLEGQKYLVNKFDELVDGERERHEKEKLVLVDRLTDARHQIGSLEQKLLQLEAPKGAVRDAETDYQRNGESREDHTDTRIIYNQ